MLCMRTSNKHKPQHPQTKHIMYNLEELNRKEKEELLNIANEMGIKNADKMDDTTAPHNH